MSSTVYPCYDNQFSVYANTLNTPAFVNIANCTTFGVSINNGVEEWNAYESEGWLSRLMTAKNVVISVSAKRTPGDDGNDFISGLAFVNGHYAEANFKWQFPLTQGQSSPASITFNNAIINVKNLGGVDAPNVALLEFDVMSNGKPTATPAVIVDPETH